MTTQPAPAAADGRKTPEPVPALALRGAGLGFGDRTLWSGLDLTVHPGEFIAVLGPNGSGKSSLLKVLLGLQPLSHGEAEVTGRAVRTGNDRVGYIPQQKMIDPGTTVRGRDLVGFGLDGHRFGVGLRGRRRRREKVDAALAEVGAGAYADRPMGVLSGGEQQRLRVAQALCGDPAVLLCDEPLLSLDLANQQTVARLIDHRRHEAGTAVLFVTHEVNPILPMVDRVLYIVDGRFAVGTPDEVLTTEVLTDLYRTPVDVLRVHGRVIVVGATDAPLDPHCQASPMAPDGRPGADADGPAAAGRTAALR
ncbi:metal ABC transporter ATP-binding protein [Tomitella fengzijianii]|uniref:Metal ABC transporter ATP-binding protein n=1 Tax=Tomitella fengzijianii TaxID=2597660 RepID=A0A516X5E7_9ACTN|nr:metal ABC transporter ATP-binding protein [Tomitella fengzijianii]QDQ98243.1 metal ABC transporter ATP-binding protein [Tomitella fengzijianii]